MKRYEPWPERIVRQNSTMHTVPSAVIVPVVLVGEEEHVLFELRSSSLGWQPGDVCFPGGRIEETDASPLAAALRETQEELGVGLEHIHVLGPLDYVESPVGVTVWPFAAYIDTTEFTVSAAEIDRLFTVPLDWFAAQQPETVTIDVATRPAPGCPQGLAISGQTEWKKRRSYSVPVYTYGTYKIWGITAQILDNFRGIRAIIAK